MKKNYVTLLLLSVCVYFTQAQTTHFIDWDTTIGQGHTITIDVGDTIEWTNVESGMIHNVVSSDPNAPAGFGSGTMNFGDSYSFTFNLPVVFDYLCGFHPGTMDGTITVLAAGSCDPPTNLMLGNVTDTTVEVSWTASPDETGGYNWAVMAVGQHPTTNTPIQNGSTATGVTNALATGLVASTNYDFYVQTDCGIITTSTWAGPLNFTTDTTGGSDCGTQFYDTGGPTGVYGNNEDEVWTFHPDTPGDVVTVTFTFVDIETSTGVGIQEGCWDFLTVYDGPDITFPIIANTLCGRADGTPPSNPNSLLSIGDSFTSTDPTGAITFRFRSDVSVTLQGWEADVTCAPPVVQTCDAPINLILNNVTDTTSNFSWTASPDETGGYAWVVMEMGGDPNTDPPVAQGAVATGTTTATATGLMPGSMYHAYVKTLCDMGVESSFSSSLHFMTNAAGCDAPTNLAPDNVTDTTADLSWTASPDETDGYAWVVMLMGDDPNTDPPVAQGTVATGITIAMVTGLTPETMYQAYVKTLCGMGAESDFSSPLHFVTDEELGIPDNEMGVLSYYPNPTSGIMTFDARTVIKSVEVFTLSGQRVIESHTNQQSVQLDLSDLATGVYMLKATFDGGTVKAIRIIKE